MAGSLSGYPEERKAANEITENTVKQKIAPVKAMRNALASKPICDVDTRDIADILDDYKSRVTPEWPKSSEQR